MELVDLKSLMLNAKGNFCTEHLILRPLEIISYGIVCCFVNN